MIYTITPAGSTNTITTANHAEAHEIMDYYRAEGREFAFTTAEDAYRPHTKTEHTARCNYDTCESYLEHFNAQVIPGHPLAWSWYFDMVEGFNAEAVSGGEWDYCWR